MSLEPPFPDSLSGRIAARSHGQVMDFSLVLASQGIEAIINQDADGAWSLTVPADQLERAETALRQYRQDNLRWRWRREVPHSELVFDWAALAWVALTWFFFVVSNQHPSWKAAGLMNGQAVAQGEWWRLFTATLLHADAAHLATNAVFGWLLLGLALGCYGSGVGLLAAFLAGVGGNVAAWLIHGEAHRSLGASGVVMGALGLLAAQSLALVRHSAHPWRAAVVGLAGGVMIFALLGVAPNSDVVAHAGGFVSGVVLGAMLALAGRRTLNPTLNLTALVVLAVLIVGTWRLALRPGG